MKLKGRRSLQDGTGVNINWQEMWPGSSVLRWGRSRSTFLISGLKRSDRIFAACSFCLFSLHFIRVEKHTGKTSIGTKCKYNSSGDA